MTEFIDIDKIILVYQNGQKISVSGDRARQIAATFFKTDPNIEKTEWEIESTIKKADKSFLRRVDDYIYDLVNKLFRK